MKINNKIDDEYLENAEFNVADTLVLQIFQVCLISLFNYKIKTIYNQFPYLKS